MLQSAKEEFKPHIQKFSIFNFQFLLQSAKEEFKLSLQISFIFSSIGCNLPKRNLNIVVAGILQQIAEKLQSAKEEFKHSYIHFLILSLCRSLQSAKEEFKQINDEFRFKMKEMLQSAKEEFKSFRFFRRQTFK